MSRLQNVSIKSQESVSVDAFGRWRVSQPVTLFESTLIHDKQPLFWDEALESGGGITSTHSSDTASTVIASTDVTAGVFTRQTFQRMHYQAGKGQYIAMTGIIQRDASGTGVKRRLGYFDDDNGVFFEDDAGTMRIVRRTSVSGAPVDDAVDQADWNVDKGDGTGPSGAIIDWSKNQIFIIDFQWLGTGCVRVCLDLSGATAVLHEFRNANVLDKVWASSPDQPCRYQMVTTIDSPAVTLECICASVMSEGGQENVGPSRYKSTEGAKIDCNAALTVYAIVGIRLKAAALDTQVSIENASLVNVANDDFEWMLILNPTLAVAVTFGDETNSGVQTAVGESSNPSTSTVTGGTVMAGGFVKSSGSTGSVAVSFKTTLKLGAAIDGTRDEIYLCCRPLTSNADINGGLSWREE